jgi:NitT/TauT family transport system substrate-binding protein
MIARRRFLRVASAGAAAAVAGLSPRRAGAEPPPETTRLKVVHRVDTNCISPQYLAADLLRGEGFTDLEYVKVVGAPGIERALASGEAHVSMHFGSSLIAQIDSGAPITILAGGHVGCNVLFGGARVRTIRDLKGKVIGMPGGSGSMLGGVLTLILAHVGLDPRRDVVWADHSPAELAQLLADGKIDAFLALPPTSYELRARKIGHVLVDSALDRPWSQYFCCMTAAHRDFVRRHPVAVKRALRAILKSADVCGTQPERAARELVDKGFTPRYDFMLETLTSLPYAKWRQYEAEDSVRFYALRMQETGLIKSSPQKIMAQGTDWQFLNQLKRELRG